MCKLMYVYCGLLLFGAVAGCGDDGGTEADHLGVGAECTASEGCDVVDEIELECLTEFKGGYCGLKGCTADTGEMGCPEGSACVTNDNGTNYCYRLCKEKSDCNQNRSVENEANCVGSGTINFVEDDTNRKACEPPSGA